MNENTASWTPLAVIAGPGDELVHAVSLSLIAPGAWQIRDRRPARGREGDLLGFVQERRGSFEVMQLADQFRWSTFPTMERAVAHIVNTNAEVVEARERGELGWVVTASEKSRPFALA